MNRQSWCVTSQDAPVSSNPLDSSSEGNDSWMESIASEYAELLERGVSVSPEAFVANHAPHDSRLLELLRSIRWIQLAARNLDDELSSSLGDGKGHHIATSSPQHPDSLGEYRLVREIGRGGMGIVYEAEQRSLARRVAVKILPPSAVLNDRQVARFAMESQAAAQLQHPNIVPIFAVGCEAGIYYYSMQYIEGAEPVSGMPPLEAAQLGLCIAEALEHAHELGIIHRDVKPSNLLIDRNGKVWITDFGLARIRNSDQLTASGAVLGTLRYMSPEQASGVQAIDHRTDIYSLGITLYELLTGRCPYDASDRVAFLAELTHGEPQKIQRLAPKVPIDLETIVHKAIAPNPSSRYASAQDMADDLRRFIHGDAILARRPTIWEKTAKWLSRNRNWAIAAGLTWSLVSIAAIVAVVLLLQAGHTNRIALKRTHDSLREADIFFAQAREVVDHFGIALSQQLADVPGAEPTRRELLHDTLQYYRHFMQQAENNPLRQREVALTYMKLGRVAEQMGATREAIEAYEQSERIWQSINPIDPDRALCANLRGMLFLQCNDRQQALEAFRLATTCNRQYVSDNQDSFEARRRLAISLTNLSLALPPDHQNASLLSSLQEALAIQLRLMQESSTTQEPSFEVSVDIAKTYGALAEAYRLEHPTQALEYSQKCIECLQATARLKSDSATPGYHSKNAIDRARTQSEVDLDLVVAYSNHAALLHDVGEIDRALRFAIQATDLGLSLCKERADSSPRLHLAASYSMLARLYGAKDQLHEQLRVFRLAHDTLSSLMDDLGGQVAYRKELVASSANLLRAAEAVSAVSIARQAQEALTTHQRWLQEHAPSGDARSPVTRSPAPAISINERAP